MSLKRFLLPLAFLPLSLLCAQEEPQPTFDIKVDSPLVVIPVTVTDPNYRYVLGLDKESFKVYEDGVEQKITQFSGEDAPISVGLLVDTSGSMGAKMDTSRRAVSELVKMMNKGDEAFLVEFSDQAKIASEFTSDTKELEERMSNLEPGGLTALLDAVDLGVREMKKAKNARKALVVVSDGGDNHSTWTPDQIKDVVREADTQIYAMGVFEPVLFPGLGTEVVSGPKLLAQLADQTGGRAFGASDFSQLPGIAEKIAIELRNQYILAYMPSNQAKDGKFRKVEVKLNQPPGLPALKLRWRTGYYAPKQ